ncbi:MAG: DNA topoisomerase IV subunit A [Rhodoluna sp.]
MAKEQIDRVPERIFDIDLSKEMQDSFLEYSYSVIYSRALPDARDGLKPVHRRIVYQMGEMGLRPDRGHVKSARVTGEVMGKLHPHGDSAIYDALVRMAQPFSLRVPLIDGHGNFGSLDDGPAAARYTEVRLSSAALMMNEGLGEDVVDFKPNYDAQLSEPEVLPAAFPNLLVNGASGIAVGMATNMPPHNMREVVKAAIYLLRNPKATLDDLMKIIPAPDFPNGGIIMVGEGIREAYELGRGSFKTRARVSVESVAPRKLGLVVTELPYLVGPEKVIEKIKEGVNAKKLQGISDVIDLTDRSNGLKLIIELKTGFDPQVVLDLLYRYTPMEDSFGINNVALVDGQPQTLGLRDLLGVYLAHRVIVTIRRSENRLGKRQARLHLVEGMLLAIVGIDEVIKIIRGSEEVQEAKTKLMKKFKLSEIQAEYILELRLRRLTKFSKLELETEKKQLLLEIAELEKILKSDKVLKDLVASELEEVAKNFGDDRRTTLMAEGEVAIVPSATKKLVNAELTDSPSALTLTASGRVYRSEDSNEPTTRKNGYRNWFATTTRSDVVFVTDSGRMLRTHVGDIPVGDSSVHNSGTPAAEFLGLGKKEKVLGVFPVDEQTIVAVGTRSGIVKRVSPDLPAKADFFCIKLKDGDRVVGAASSVDSDELVFITQDAQLLRFDAGSVRAQGVNGAGMAGIKTDSEVIFFGVIKPKEKNVVLTVANSSASLPGTDGGGMKVTKLAEFPKKGRATGGVRCQKFIRGQNQIVLGYVGPEGFQLVDSKGKAIGVEYELQKRDASGDPVPAITFIGRS